MADMSEGEVLNEPGTGEGSAAADPAVEQQARDLGWAPKEDFKGDPEKWVDAATYVERGEQVLPLVKATNRRLREDLSRQAEEQRQLKEALAQSQATIQALQEYHESEIKERVKRTREDLLANLGAAIKDEDIDRQVQVTDELTRLNAATAAPSGEKKKTNGSGSEEEVPPDHTSDPDYVAWREDNQWFGEDRVRTLIALDQARELRRTGDTTKGRAFLNKVQEATNREIARFSGRPPPSRVEGGSPGTGDRGGGGGTSGKSFSDLPADAKVECDKFARDPRLVGPGKLHKDVNSFRAFYATKYFREL